MFFYIESIKTDFTEKEKLKIISRDKVKASVYQRRHKSKIQLLPIQGQLFIVNIRLLKIDKLSYFFLEILKPRIVKCR